LVVVLKFGGGVNGHLASHPIPLQQENGTQTTQEKAHSIAHGIILSHKQSTSRQTEAANQSANSSIK
jgi:hypothetical protein